MITYLMIETGEIQTRYPWTTMENIKEQIETSIVSGALSPVAVFLQRYTVLRSNMAWMPPRLPE
jgi:hypothetical protein